MVPEGLVKVIRIFPLSMGYEVCLFNDCMTLTGHWGDRGKDLFELVLHTYCPWIRIMNVGHFPSLLVKYLFSHCTFTAMLRRSKVGLERKLVFSCST